MSSSQRGNQLGPYKLEQRYRNTGDLGRVYRARNTLTGAPALVVKPTERSAEDDPLADWELHLFSSVSPAYLALEVKSAPEAANAEAAGEELEYMLDDLLEAVIHTRKRPETLRHLRSPRRVPRRPVSHLHRVFGAALAAAFTGLILFAGNSGPPLTPVAERELALARHDAGWDGSGDLTGGALTGLVDFEPFALTRPMPTKPFKVQKKPPCKTTIEEEHANGCWVRLHVNAPCPDEAYERDGRCYLPAIPAAPPPASIMP
ncbi:hypothetical protein [Archangium primigenium]|uniref:hypothetical protein n=1 Tax=[Archangium] primigenium TaxID=2792470 RepID=UPI00195A8ACD|nr:hypothetical protein [Archangium primigenium]MBM7117650.1 hypothetical protein [Archangium primigenium]